MRSKITYRGIDPQIKSNMKMWAQPMMSMPGPAGEPYRNLWESGTYFEKKASTKRVRGIDKQCYQNSIDCEEGDMYCGYAMMKSNPVPIGHCWNVIDGTVVDTTPIWNENDAYYWGINIDRSVAQEVLNNSLHGNEFMDSWRSAVQNVSQEKADEWREKLGWWTSDDNVPLSVLTQRILSERSAS